MPVPPGYKDYIHHYITDTVLPYISNASVVEPRNHFIDGSNILTTIYNYIARRPGWGRDTNDNFSTQNIERLFLWERWDGTRYKILNTTSSTPGTSEIRTLKIGTDTAYNLIYTSSVSTAFDFVVDNNTLYAGNGTNMVKWDATTVNLWGIAKPAAVATTSSLASGSITASNGGYSWKYAFGNNTTGHVGQIADATIITGNFTSLNYVISGSATTDPQVDLVHIYRTADGGGTWFEEPNSPVTYSGSWSMTTSSTDRNLTITEAPLANQNAPPPPSRYCKFFASRIWTASGSLVHYSNWEEQREGVEQESFNTTNNFSFGQLITGQGVTQRALLPFTASDVFRVIGDSLSTFQRQPFLERMGATTQANIASGGLRNLGFLSTAGTAHVTDGVGVEEIGLPVRSDLAGIDQSKSSVGFHFDGVRSWFAVQDSGQDKMWIYDVDNGVWMVPWSQGGTAVGSLETAQGSYQLLIGRSGRPLVMTTTTYTDQDGSAYTAFIKTGLMEMGQGQGPGEVANFEYFALERNGHGLSNVQFIQDEDPSDGTFTTIFPNLLDNAPNRTQGTKLVEDWFYRTTTSGTARRIAMRLDWTSSASEFILYSMDTMTNEIQGV
jgi:hypothetical protein